MLLRAVSILNEISLVVNYDIPLDAESYVHRIGRTGRAGRSGRALLFVEPRERRLLRNIEHLMKKPINEVELPNHEVLQACRRKKFQDRLPNNWNITIWKCIVAYWKIYSRQIRIKKILLRRC